MGRAAQDISSRSSGICGLLLGIDRVGPPTRARDARLDERAALPEGMVLAKAVQVRHQPLGDARRREVAERVRDAKLLEARLRARARCLRSSSRDMASTDSLVALSSCVQAALEFFKARLIDTIEEKQKKAAQQMTSALEKQAEELKALKATAEAEGKAPRARSHTDPAAEPPNFSAANLKEEYNSLLKSSLFGLFKFSEIL